MIPGFSFILSILDAISGVFAALKDSNAPGVAPPGTQRGAGQSPGDAGLKLADESGKRLADQIADAISRQVLQMKGAVSITNAPPSTQSRPTPALPNQDERLPEGGYIQDVEIAAPLPVPVTMVGGAIPPELAQAPPEATKNPYATRDEKTKAGIKEMIEAVTKLGSASTTAFAALSAGMAGLAAAAAPALFSTLTCSAQLLAAVLGQALVEPILRVSFAIQDAARWVKELDPALKASIGTWTAWGAGALGVVAVLGKVTGLVTAALPAFAALKAAAVFTIGNPFGLLIAGLGAVAVASPQSFKPLLELGPKLVPMFQSIANAVQPIVGALASTLAPAVQIVAGGIAELANLLGRLTSFLGPTATGMIAVGAAAYAMVGPFGAFIALGTAAVSMLGKIHPMLGQLAAGLTAAAVAANVMGVATMATPWGLLITGIAGATGALLAMAGAYAKVAQYAEAASASMDRLHAMAERIHSGKVSDKDLNALLTPDERKKINDAKNAKDPQKLIDAVQDTLADAKASQKVDFLPKKKLEQAQIALGKTIEQTKDMDSDDTLTALEKMMGRESNFDKRKSKVIQLTMQQLKEAGFTDVEAHQLIKHHWKTEDSGVDDALKKGKKVTLDDIAKAGASLEVPPKQIKVKIAALEGLLRPNPQGAGEEKIRQLQQFQGRYGMAFLHEMQPARLNLEDVRGTFQNTLLAKDPIQSAILEVQRDTYAKMREVYPEIMKKLDEILKGVK
jgi:hypothetical protein